MENDLREDITCPATPTPSSKDLIRCIYQTVTYHDAEERISKMKELK